MTSAVPVSVIALELDDRDDVNVIGPPKWASCWIDLVSFALIVGSALSAPSLWQDLFSTVDRIALSFSIVFGLIIAIAHANWRGDRDSTQ